MLQRLFAAALFLFAVTAAAAPKAIAPSEVSHGVAMFLSNLCASGKQKVTLRAAAAGKQFFLEEAAGVTVYTYDGNGYRKEAFLKSATLERAMKRYGARL